MVQLFKPQFPEALTGKTYGSGWIQGSYRGRELLFHLGATNGFSSIVAFMPQEEIGVAWVANLDSTRSFALFSLSKKFQRRLSSLLWWPSISLWDFNLG
jgi:CubicO group peptidase (beta-lactamase class C family)